MVGSCRPCAGRDLVIAMQIGCKDKSYLVLRSQGHVVDVEFLRNVDDLFEVTQDLLNVAFANSVREGLVTKERDINQ